jgi:putative phosphoesterase
MRRIGLISDTHGLLRPEAIAALRGCSRILHAGDVGEPSILDRLAALAPVTAVRGNNDTDSWFDCLPEEVELDIEGVLVRVLHDRGSLEGSPPPGCVVVTGHSHKPMVETIGGALYVNPGSAGPRRFKLPVAVAELIVSNGCATAQIIELAIGPKLRGD